MKKAPATKTSAKGPGSKPAAKGPASKPAAKGTAAKGTAAKPPEKKLPAPTPPQTINLKAVTRVVVADEDGQIASSGKWAIIVDPSERINTFLRYTHANFFDASLVTDMRAETLRQGLLGALKHGRIFAIFVPTAKEYEIMEKVLTEIHSDLMSMLLNRSIIKEECFMKITKESDGADYQWHSFPPDNLAAFRFCLVTSDPGLPSEIMNNFAPIIIEE